MIHFPNRMLRRYSLVDVGETGVYGEPLRVYHYVDDIICDFQNENNHEIRKDYGVEKHNLYKIYLDANTELQSTDKLYDSNGHAYVIVGEIQEYTTLHKYKKVHVIKERYGGEFGGREDDG